MTITSAAALRRMCEVKDWNITNLEANKLLYFAQMIALGEFDKPLVDEYFEAWDLGPVLPGAYHKAKMFGDKPIKKFIFSSRGPIASWEAIFQRTLEEFGHLKSGQLVADSHWPQGAWAEHYTRGARGVEIPNDDILKEYRRRTAN